MRMSELEDYLSNRRSDLAMTLVDPAPDADQINTMIKLAARVPDHGKLCPWRFIEYPYDQRQNLVKELIGLSNAEADTIRKESRTKEITRFQSAPLVIGVISRASQHPKVPEWEQVLSAGAATMQLLVAANALGFGSQWLTGWYTQNEAATALLGIGDGEKVAGMVHIGTATAEKIDRARPEINDIHSIYSPSK